MNFRAVDSGEQAAHRSSDFPSRAQEGTARTVLYWAPRVNSLRGRCQHGEPAAGHHHNPDRKCEQYALYTRPSTRLLWAHRSCRDFSELNTRTILLQRCLPVLTPALKSDAAVNSSIMDRRETAGPEGPERPGAAEALDRSDGPRDDAPAPVSTHAPPGPMDEGQLAWLALALTPGLGPRRILQAVASTGSAARVLSLSLTELEALGFPATAVQCIADGRALREAEEEWLRVAAAGGSTLNYADEAYPERLREIFDPPPVLWVRGDAGLLERFSIAVVGTRHPTPYGAGMAEML